MTLEDARNRIKAMDREHAPTSETILLGYALRDLDEVPEADLPARVAWWEGAYRAHAAGEDADTILDSGNDYTDWQAPTNLPWACPVHGLQNLNLCQRTVIYWPISGRKAGGKYLLPGGYKVDDESDDGFFVECLAMSEENGVRRSCQHQYPLDDLRDDQWPFEWT